MSINSIIPIREITAINLASDTTYANEARGLYVGTSGDVEIIDGTGATVTIPNLAAGVWHGIITRGISSTANGTTASDVLIGR